MSPALDNATLDQNGVGFFISSLNVKGLINLCLTSHLLQRLAIVKNVVFGSDWQDYLVVELLYQFARAVE